jgi:hypothetical protein
MAGLHGALLNLLLAVLSESARSVALVVLLCMLRRAFKVLICTLAAVFEAALDSERTRRECKLEVIAGVGQTQPD